MYWTTDLSINGKIRLKALLGGIVKTFFRYVLRRFNK